MVGLFGVGGSPIATPLLSVLGVPGLLAVASPLPATIPAALAAVIPYLRTDGAQPRAAAWTVLDAIPATVAGALLSRVVGGPALLLASGVVLVIVGARVIRPIEETTRRAGAARRANRVLLVATAAGVGLFTGLLANGGGFLLVPMYLVVFGLDMRQAAGTSLLVIAGLTVPTLATHWGLGHVDGASPRRSRWGWSPPAPPAPASRGRSPEARCAGCSAGSSSPAARDSSSTGSPAGEPTLTSFKGAERSSGQAPRQQ
ncbi:sulfite exporter TauE/SafE family protein [Pseudofrankia sp. DC12]|uniref:TSUP family transporter n=1 Tax=Pseudofrankia sp. DC12 TaxID=683315 RepID=UPI0018DBAB9C